jgi:glycosyltransferase involved in cell wall biosynthesis
MKVSSPVVTVAIPTLRRPGYLMETLTTVLEQSYANLQIIVSNDASGDETTEIMRSVNDPRILFLENTGGQIGMIANWNRCVAAAKGKYFVLVGDDDRVGPQFVEAMVEVFEGRDDVMVGVCPQEVIDAGGKVVRRLAWPTDKYMPGRRFVLERYNGKQPYATLVSAFYQTTQLQDIGGFPAFALGANSDNGVVIRLAPRGVVGFAAEALFQYRVYDASWGLKAYRSIAVSVSELLDYISTDEVRAAYGEGAIEPLLRRVATVGVRDYLGRINAYFLRDHSFAEVWDELTQHGLMNDARLRLPYLVAIPKTLARLAAWKLSILTDGARGHFGL